MKCELDNNRYAVSVANALLFDTACEGDQLFANAKTLLNSSITQAIQSTTVYSGKGSQANFEFNYQKEITVALEDSVFSPAYLAAQNGTAIVKKLTEFYTQEEVTFDAVTGVATLTGTPKGNVQVQLEDGKFMAVIPVTNSITVPSLAGKTVPIVYAEENELDTITIDAATFPKTLKLVLNIDIFDNEKGLVEQMQITIPRFKPDGNMEISLSHDGVATSSLAGKALVCGGKYAEIAFKPVGAEEDTCLTQIVAMPHVVELDDADPTATATITLLGVRGLGNTMIPNTKATWTSVDPSVATVVNGVVSLVGVSGTTTTVNIEVTEGGKTFTDSVVVNVI